MNKLFHYSNIILICKTDAVSVTEADQSRPVNSTGGLVSHNIHRYFPQYFPHFTCSTSASTRPHFTGSRRYYITVYCDYSVHIVHHQLEGV